jgi:hypothetical protein
MSDPDPPKSSSDKNTSVPTVKNQPKAEFWHPFQGWWHGLAKETKTEFIRGLGVRRAENLLLTYGLGVSPHSFFDRSPACT